LILQGRFILVISLILFLLSACIEQFDFVIKNEHPSLVIEAQISNVSFNESRDYPSDGRYFEVILRLTSDVINIRDEVVSNAKITLEEDSGLEWSYTETPEGSGHYYLLSDDFKAIEDRKYKLKVRVSENESYESSWEHLPVPGPTMGEICFEESEIQKFVIEAGEKVLNTIPGVQVGIDLSNKDPQDISYYRWDFEPTWIYIAPLASGARPNRVCWATNVNYISKYELQEDKAGGYRKDLFFMEVPQNERILTDFSMLVRQYTTSEDYYYFWDELREQTNRGTIFDAPPYNLRSNFESPQENSKRVSGYFGVVEEQAKRWYFNIDDLSYYTEDFLLRVCQVPYVGGPAAECLNCLEYSKGSATLIKPTWWR